MVKIHFWRITYSGVVEAPVEIRKKEKKKPEVTEVMWELTFEEPPFFRSFTANRKEAIRRYDSLIRNLISEQEIKSTVWISPTRRLGILTWYRWVDKKAVPESFLKLYEDLNLTEEEREALIKELVKVPIRPHYRIDDYSYEEAIEPIEIEAPAVGVVARFIAWVRKLLRMPVVPPVKTAKDIYTFTVYRPPYSNVDAIGSWKGECVHDL